MTRIVDIDSVVREECERESLLLGDDSPRHHGEGYKLFSKFKQEGPSAPAAFMLYKAERWMQANKKVPRPPFNVRVRLPKHSYYGDYEVEQEYEDHRAAIKFCHNGYENTASFIFSGFDGYCESASVHRFVAYSFGDIIKKFFEGENRRGSLLGKMDLEYFGLKKELPLEIRLNHIFRQGEDHLVYNVEGEGRMAEDLVIKFKNGIFFYEPIE